MAAKIGDAFMREPVGGGKCNDAWALNFMHEVAYLWIEYFWSSLKGNGPEARADLVLVVPGQVRVVRREGERGLGVFERCECFFEFVMRRQ